MNIQSPASEYVIMNHPESFRTVKHLITVDRNPFFFQHYGLTENDLEHYLAAALSADETVQARP